MDLVQEGDHYVLRADLPGVREEDVNIEVEDNVLTISGERKSEQEDRKEGYYRVERAVGRFSRSLTLPEGVDPDSIEAQFENGVLTVRIPKPEEREPRRVAISVGDQAPVIEGSGSESSRGTESSTGGRGSQGERSGSDRGSSGEGSSTGAREGSSVGESS